MSASRPVTVVPMTLASVPGVVALQPSCFPPPFPADQLWQAAHLQRHLEIFPEGQWVALSQSGEVVASASSCRISETAWNAHDDWETTLGGCFFEAFDPQGTTLYGADISVHPEWRGQGIARALYEARFQVVGDLGLTRYGTTCRLPDYQTWSVTVHPLGTPTDYAQRVVTGELTDRTLTPLLRLGLRYRGVQEGAMTDEESGHAAAILEWTP